MCPTTGRSEVSSLDSQLKVPFLPRSTFNCMLALANGGLSWNPPHLRDCVGASLSDDSAPLPGISFHTLLRMKDAGLPVSSSATQLLVRSARVPANARASVVWRRQSSRTSSPCGRWDPSRLSILPLRFNST